MKSSQTSLVLTALIAAQGKWVPMTELARVSKSYNISKRTSDCRKLGYQVDNRIEVQPDGSKHSFYRIVPGGALTNG